MGSARSTFLWHVPGVFVSAVIGLWSDGVRAQGAAETMTARVVAGSEAQRIRLTPAPGKKEPPVVTAVGLQPGGAFLALAGDDHVIRLCRVVDRRVTSMLEWHTDWVRTLAYSPDGKLLASGGNDRHICLWDGRTGARVRTLPASEAVTALAFSHDGRWLAAIGFAARMRVYDVATGELKQELGCPCKDMRVVVFSPDDRLVAAGGRNGKLRIWDFATGRSHHEIEAHRQRIRALAFSPDGTQLVSAGEDRVVRVWSVDSGQEEFTLPTRAAKVFAVEFCGSDLLATAGSDNLIHLWDLKTQQEVLGLAGHSGSVASLVCDGTTLVSGSYDTTVRVWNLAEHFLDWTRADHPAHESNREPGSESEFFTDVPAGQ